MPDAPWFAIALFPSMALSVAIVVRSLGNAAGRIRAARQPVPLAAGVDAEQVAQMHAEIDELRTQVERLAAAQAFYAELQPVPSHGALPAQAGAPLS
jgi:hypothetical protein